MPESNFSCEECQVVWSDYSRATRALLKLASSRQIARIRQDSTLLAEIEPMYHEAMQRRDSARKLVTAHAALHPGSGRMAASQGA